MNFMNSMGYNLVFQQLHKVYNVGNVGLSGIFIFQFKFFSWDVSSYSQHH